MTQQITQHKVTDSKKPNECELSTKVTLRKIGRILMIVQNNIVELLRREGKRLFLYKLHELVGETLTRFACSGSTCSWLSSPLGDSFAARSPFSPIRLISR